MHNLTVALATYNEEENIENCLESVKDIASEIVIVDGSSTDRTVEFAKKFGAKILVTTNPPIFHINKQKAIDAADCDWILQLDADERLTPELASEIKVILSNDKEKRKGFWIPRKNWFLGKFLMKGGVYPDYTLRLYRKGKGKLPQKDVHEQAAVEGDVGYLKNPLIHIADPEFGRYLKRFGRYTDLIAGDLKKNNTNFSPTIGINHMIFLPIGWFLKSYVRHKGFMDGWQGFVFSFFSSLRFPVSYIKYLREKL